MVLERHQTDTSTVGQLLEEIQVRGLLSGELWLHLIDFYQLFAELLKAPTEQLSGGKIHHPESGHAILQPSADLNSVVGQQLVVVTYAQVRELKSQGL